MMDLKELRYFRAIAEFGTFSKAAAHLRVAQPALSRQIRKLEHKLGVELLNRTSRGVTPTEAGQVLLERTRSLEHELEMTRREVSKFSSEVTGSLRVAVGSPFSTIMIPQLMKQYQEQCPHVSVHLIEGYSADITNGLLSERIDMAICQAPSHPHPDLTVFPLFLETVDLVGPAQAADTPLFRDGVVPIEDIADLKFIMPSQSHGVRRLVEAAFARRHIKFRPQIEADGPKMIFEMVKAGLGYTLMPGAGYQPYIERGYLVKAKVQPAILRTTAIITRTALLHDRTVVPFIDLVKVAVPWLIATPRFASATAYPGEGAASSAAAGWGAPGEIDVPRQDEGNVVPLARPKGRRGANG